MILLIDKENASEEIQHAFIINAQKKVRIDGMFLHMIKALYGKPTANIILNEENLKPFPLQSAMRQGCLLSLLLFSSFGIPSQSSKARARNETDSNREGRSHVILICR
jgi:hypothetical protein